MSEAREDVPLPEPGRWPCQYEPAVDLPTLLVAFLYRLLRDGASCPGAVEEHAIAVSVHAQAPPGVEPVYTNAHLEAYARALAGFLIGSSRDLP